MLKADVNVVILEIRRPYAILNDVDEFTKRPVLPSLGGTIAGLHVFMAGESEADEPLAVEQPRRFLQQRNPLPVVLDQVVVGRDNLANMCSVRKASPTGAPSLGSTSTTRSFAIHPSLGFGLQLLSILVIERRPHNPTPAVTISRCPSRRPPLGSPLRSACPSPLRRWRALGSAGHPAWPRNGQCTNNRLGPVAGGRSLSQAPQRR